MTTIDLSIVIPSWNGLELLRRHLPSAIRACQEMGRAEVIVVDDGSEDDTATHIAREHPQIRIVRRASQGGFSVAANAGVAASRAPAIVLVNSDVEMLEGAIPPLLEAIHDPCVFAAVPRILRVGSDVDESKTVLRFRRGTVSAGAGGRDGSVPAYACGAAMAFRREAFEGLGGFDPLFSPFYWEDVDLSYRARKRGLGIVRVAAAAVLHDHNRTIGSRFGRDSVATVYERNRLIFTWKNLTDAGLFVRHLVALPAKLLWDSIAHRSFVRGFSSALPVLREIASRRDLERRQSKVRDRELLPGREDCGWRT